MKRISLKDWRAAFRTMFYVGCIVSIIAFLIASATTPESQFAALP
jgi:hypothetical protein